MENLKILKKAYCLNLEKIVNGFHHSEIVVYADTRGQAKQKISGEIDYEDFEVEYIGEMNFLNMPVKRSKQDDKIEYKGIILKRWELDDKINIENHNKKLDGFLENDDIEFCYIRKRGSYYGWNYAGYTSFKHKAGIYSKEDAVKHCKNIIELECIPINIEEHNAILKTEIDEIKKGIIVSVNCR